MMGTTNVTVRMDEGLKKQFETIMDDMGISMSGAFNMFAKSVVRNERMPAEITDVRVDPFFSPANMATLNKSIEQDQKGEVITFDNLEEAQKAALEHYRDAH